MRRPLSPASEQGFTLLELTISIAIVAFIVLITASALRLGVRSVESAEKRLLSLERVRSSLTIVDNQLQSQIPLSYDEDGAKKYLFTGNKTSLRFPSNFSIWGGQRGYVEIAYAVESRDNGKKSLGIKESVVGAGKGGETTLFADYDDISFEYFFRDPTEEKGKWVDSWTEGESIPEKVRLHLVSGKSDFTLIIPLRVRGATQGQGQRQGQLPGAVTGTIPFPFFPGGAKK